MKDACVVIGHNPKRFKFKYNETYSLCKKIKKAIKEQIIQLYHEGVRRFYVGGSLGIDIWTGEIVLRLKEQTEYKEIELAMVLPFPEHDKNWDKRSKTRLAFLMKHSVEKIIMGKTDCWRSYIDRNQYMINQAEYLIAVYDNIPDERTQITQIVEYAKKKKLRIIIIHPDTANIAIINMDDNLKICK